MKNDGGPAFPVSVRKTEKYMDEGGYGRTRDVQGLDGGLSLRDYFAAAALQALGGTTFAAESSPAMMAAECYVIADAMLAERAKP